MPELVIKPEPADDCPHIAWWTFAIEDDGKVAVSQEYTDEDTGWTTLQYVTMPPRVWRLGMTWLNEQLEIANGQ